MKKVVCRNVYIFPAQRLRVVWGLCQGSEGYLIGWKLGKDKQLRCVLMLDDGPDGWNGKWDFPMEIVRPIPKSLARSSDGSAA